MKTGWALFFLIGLTLVFEVKPLWVDSGDITEADYRNIELSREDSVKAINNFRKNTHLNDIGFYVQPFPLSKQKVTKKTGAYFGFEHLFVIGILVLWLLDDGKDSKKYVGMFLFFMVGDFFDYLIHYNEDYGSPWLSYNIFFVLLYLMFLIMMQWRRQEN